MMLTARTALHRSTRAERGTSACRYKLDHAVSTLDLEVRLFDDADPQLGLVGRGGAQQLTLVAGGQQVVHHHLGDQTGGDR